MKIKLQKSDMHMIKPGAFEDYRLHGSSLSLMASAACVAKMSHANNQA